MRGLADVSDPSTAVRPAFHPLQEPTKPFSTRFCRAVRLAESSFPPMTPSDRRPLQAPGTRDLVGVRRPQQCGLVESSADELMADREPAGRKAARQRDCG